MDEPTDELPRFGVVCVHGIGAQSQGSTADSVLQAVQAGVAELGGTLTAPSAVDCNDCVAHQTVVSIPDVGEFELHVYDAWWDRLVEPPRLGTVLRWLMKVGPLVITAMVGALATELELMRTRRSPHKTDDNPPVEMGLPMLITTLVTPLLYLLIPLIAVICALPKGGRHLRSIFTTILGDAWLYKSGECDVHVIPYIENILNRANQANDFVVLLGHSQGAELSRRVAIQSQVEIGSCVWIGSGRIPLTFLRAIDWNRWFAPLMVLYTAVFPLLFTWLMLSFLPMTILMLKSLLIMALDAQSIVDGHVPESTDWSSVKELAMVLLQAVPSFIALAVVPLIIVLVSQRNSRGPSDIDMEPPCEVMAIKSPLDPVAFGVEEKSIVRYVPPRRSPITWLSEHTSYFQKTYTGLALLEALLGSELVAYDKYEPRTPRWVKALSIAAFAVLFAIYLTVGMLEFRLLFQALGIT